MIGTTLAGALLAVAAGLAAGLCGSPIKFMKIYKFEHWAFLYSLVGMLILPWLAAFVLCPDLLGALSSVPLKSYLLANAFSIAWGAANVLCCICLVRIGFSLTFGILTGVGLPIGVLLPMVMKGSGQFADAPSLFSSVGLVLSVITAFLVLAVAMMAWAGFERERSGGGEPSPAFKSGIFMAALGGVLQVGLSFAFIYSQAPLSEALKAHGASASGSIAGVWAATLPGGALVNVLFPLLLMLKKGTGKSLLCLKDFALSLVMGVLFVALVLCMGNGMILLGALGASVGFGVYQGFQILSAQSVGVFSGEWRNAAKAPKLVMTAAIILALLCVIGLSVAKAF